jgi:hypothetical protein
MLVQSKKIKGRLAVLLRKREALDNHMETLENSELNQHVLHSMQRTSNALKAMGLDKSLKDVDKVMSGRINRHYTCTYPEKRVADGKMFFKGTCVDKRGRKVNVTATGTYSPTAFTLTANLSGKVAGVRVSAVASTSAKRLGDVCPMEVQKLK